MYAQRETAVSESGTTWPSIEFDELLTGCRRLVVVAPHPDDETLAVGGVLAAAFQRKFPVAVILVTDGETSHLADVPRREAVQRVRPLESLLALRELGWTRPRLQRLQLPGSAVALAEHELAGRLERLLRADDRVLTTWRYDGHTDHEATARAVVTVAAAIGCACAQFPIWSRVRTLDGDTRADGHVRRFELDAATLERKRRALRAYRSQLLHDPVSGAAPVLFPAMVSRFLVPFEVVIL